MRDREGWKGEIKKGHKENMKNDQYVPYFDYGDGFMNVDVYQSYQTVYLIYVQFTVSQLQCNKAV